MKAEFELRERQREQQRLMAMANPTVRAQTAHEPKGLIDSSGGGIRGL